MTASPEFGGYESASHEDWARVLREEGMSDIFARPPAEVLWWTLDYRPVVGIGYRYFGAGDGGTMRLYVGVTDRPPKIRKAEHARLDLWWPLVRHDLTEIVEFTNKLEMYEWEDAELRDPTTIGLFNVMERSAYRRGPMAAWRKRGVSAHVTRQTLGPPGEAEPERKPAKPAREPWVLVEPEPIPVAKPFPDCVRLVLARNPEGLTRPEVVAKATSSRRKDTRKGIAPELRATLDAMVESGEVTAKSMHHRGMVYRLTNPPLTA